MLSPKFNHIKAYFWKQMEVIEHITETYVDKNEKRKWKKLQEKKKIVLALRRSLGSTNED